MHASASILQPRGKAFSLVEMTISVAVIGILSGIAISTLSSLHPAASRISAGEALARLNAAVAQYQNLVAEINRPALTAEATDELAVLALLTATDAAVPGTPFIRNANKMIASSSTQEQRARWNGKWFELVPRKTAGTGLTLGQE